MKFNKISAFVLGMMIWGSIGCEKDPVTDPNTPPPCAPEVITDYQYFEGAVTLSNRCQGVDYIIKASIFKDYSVEGALVIEPGTTVQFESSVGLKIEKTGSITAMGTAASPIILKGITDGVVGSWKGLYIRTSNINNKLDYVQIEGAGSGSYNSIGAVGSVILDRRSKVSINNCTIEDGGAYGLHFNHTEGDLASLMNNTFKNNDNPILIRANYLHQVDASNTFEGNTNRYIHAVVGSAISTSETWQNLSIPYRLHADGNGALPRQYIENSGQLTIAPGTTVEFASGTALFVRNNAGIVIKGTPTNPITLTGSSKVAGYWSGIDFKNTQNSINEIAYATIEYAGSGDGAIDMDVYGPKLTVSNTTFKDIANCVFYDRKLTGTNPNLTRTNVTYSNVTSQYCN